VLAQVQHHHWISNRWGLGERHTSGRRIAFNLAGQPGTEKTICVEAISGELGLKLLVANYVGAESMWFGETAKNIVATFRAAAAQNVAPLFHEPGAIAMRHSSGASRRMNAKAI
jgi:SpoVK/Ycf46/Vps4 family AAA+-type ATPase